MSPKFWRMLHSSLLDYHPDPKIYEDGFGNFLTWNLLWIAISVLNKSIISPCPYIINAENVQKIKCSLEAWKHNVSQQTFNVDSTLIYVEITWRRRSTWYPRYSTSICQRWFMDQIQRWNNVDFGLTLETILFLHHDALKIKIFIFTLKR